MSLKRIGALWRPKPGGKAALSGTIDLLGDSLRVVVLKNERKRNERDPDYILHRALDDQGDNGPRPRQSRGEGDDL
jgi:hypothetical protein